MQRIPKFKSLEVHSKLYESSLQYLRQTFVAPTSYTIPEAPAPVTSTPSQPSPSVAPHVSESSQTAHYARSPRDVSPHVPARRLYRAARAHAPRLGQCIRVGPRRQTALTAAVLQLVLPQFSDPQRVN